MSVSSSSTLILGWAIDCETVMREEPRFDIKTGQKVEPVFKFSHYVLRVAGHVLPVELMDKHVYDEGDVGVLYTSKSRQTRYGAADDFVEITGMCYGQVVLELSSDTFKPTDKGCDKIYPVEYQVSAKLKKFQDRYGLPEPTLFSHLSFG